MDFERRRDQLIQEGHRDPRPNSIKMLRLGSGDGARYRLRYGISTIPPGETRRITTRTATETLPDRERTLDRMLVLQSLQRGIPGILVRRPFPPASEKYISEYQTEYHRHRLSVYASTKYLPEEDAERSEEVRSVLRHGESLREYLGTRGVCSLPQLSQNAAVMLGFKRFLLESPAKGRREGVTLSVRSVNLRIQYFHAFVHFLQGQGIGIRSFPEVSAITDQERKRLGRIGNRREKDRRALTREEVLTIYRDLPPMWVVPFVFMVSTGCRLGKTLRLLDDELDMENRVLRLVGYKEVEYQGRVFVCRQKNGRDLLIPMNDELHACLTIHREWRTRTGIQTPFVFFVTAKGTPGFPRLNNFLSRFKKTCRRCRIAGDVDLHSLRKTKSTELIELTMRDAVGSAQTLLGHHPGSGITARHYYHQTPAAVENLRDQLNQLQYGFDLDLIRRRLIKSPSSA